MVSRATRPQAPAVVFGYDAAEYQSSSAHMNRFAGSRHATVVAVTGADAVLKPAENINKQCHVEFGEPGKQRRDFSLSSTQLSPTGELHTYAGRLSASDKEMLTRTSAGFGPNVAPFVTSTQLATQWDKDAVAATVALRNEIRRRTGPRPTRGMSYDDDVEYVSEATSAFENKLTGFKPSDMAESVKNDLRATHFTVGHETLDYRTSSHIPRLPPDQFALYATRQVPLHDLKKATVEIT